MIKNKSNLKLAVAMLAVMVAVILVAGAVPAMAGVNTTGTANCQGAGVGRMGGSLVDTAADVLGISRQDIANERRNGKSLADIAAEKNMDKEALTKAVLEKRQDSLQQALKDQKITQEQYEQCTQLMKDRIEQNLTRTDVGPNGQGAGKGKGMQGSKRGGKGMCSGVCPMGRGNSQQ